MKELILLKVAAKSVSFATIGFYLNHGLNYVFNGSPIYVIDHLCNGCHDLSMLSVNISNIAVITVKNVDYCCIIHNSKSEAVNLLKNRVLEDRGYI